jgi:hypothetical protein
LERNPKINIKRKKSTSSIAMPERSNPDFQIVYPLPFHGGRREW